MLATIMQINNKDDDDTTTTTARSTSTRNNRSSNNGRRRRRSSRKMNRHNQTTANSSSSLFFFQSSFLIILGIMISISISISILGSSSSSSSSCCYNNFFGNNVLQVQVQAFVPSSSTSSSSKMIMMKRRTSTTSTSTLTSSTTSSLFLFPSSSSSSMSPSTSSSSLSRISNRLSLFPTSSSWSSWSSTTRSSSSWTNIGGGSSLTTRLTTTSNDDEDEVEIEVEIEDDDEVEIEDEIETEIEIEDEDEDEEIDEDVIKIEDDEKEIDEKEEDNALISEDKSISDGRIISSHKMNNNIFHNAIKKFQKRPTTYLMIPIIAACVGWFTNYLAVQMIFYPIQYKGISLYRRPEIPLGLIGWQGIVPCKTRTMSKALTDMVQEQLLTIPEAFERLNPYTVAKHLSQSVPSLGTDIINDVAFGGVASVAKPTGGGFPLGIWNFITHPKRIYTGVVNFINTQILTGVIKDLISQSQNIFNLENCVVNQMLLDRSKLGQLFQKVGSVELDFLVNSGLWFGFLLGIIQMIVALVWNNPWSLSIGGMIVGLATNWLALKWIFEPVLPTKICFGLFEIQGMFLKRQKEVAAEFSNFFASNIVTSEQIWSSILTDTTTKPTVSIILEKHIKRLLSIASFGLLKGIPNPELIGKVTASTITKLPSHLPTSLHNYVDAALGLETTLRKQMELMSPAKFERVLHPIFEQDELTLIIAGGVLGFAAGLIQQGIETGSITIPSIPTSISKPIQDLIQKCKTILLKFKVSIFVKFALLRRRIINMGGGGGGDNDSSNTIDNGNGVSGE